MKNHSGHYGAVLQLRDDGMLMDVLTLLNTYLMGSFPFSPNIIFSLNLISTSVSVRKDECGKLPIVVPTLHTQRALQEKDIVFDPGVGLLAPLEISAPLISGYNLRSSAKKGAGGFGRGKSLVARGRGRISFLAKSQDRAMMDVHDGRQILIDRALRESQSLKPGV